VRPRKCLANKLILHFVVWMKTWYEVLGFCEAPIFSSRLFWPHPFLSLIHPLKPQNFISNGTFHLSELTGQTIPILMRISLLIKTISQISQMLNSMCEGDGFQQEPFGKSRFHLLTDWSSIGLAIQFWQMESDPSFKKQTPTAVQCFLANFFF